MTEVVHGLADGIRVSLSALSREFGVARETVGRRIMAAGVKPDGERAGHPVYRLGPAARAVLQLDQPGSAIVDNPEDLPPKERLDYYRSERERLKLRLETEQVIDAGECRAQMAEIVKVVVYALETLPDMLERDYSLNADVVARIESVINAARIDVANKLEG